MEKGFFARIISWFKSLFLRGQETIVVPNPDVDPTTEPDTGTTVTAITPITIDDTDMIEDNNELNLELRRIFTNSGYTIGHLFINGEYVCDTIEDADRGLRSDMPLKEIKAKKVYGETAIPTGTYDITMNTKSQKYSDFERYKWAKDYDGYLPRLLNVPGFEGVLIHVGNYANPDSLGCILVGFNKAKGMVTDSTTTFKMLMNKYLVPASKQNTKISIKIIAQY